VLSAVPAQPGLAALPAVQFLVDSAAAALPAAAAAAAVKPAPKRSAVPKRSFDERVVWIIDLFERQAAQSRATR
jgi:hypothetical protein